MKKIKKRYFIVEPQYEDSYWFGLFKVCSTTSRDSFLNVYWIDNYKEEKDFNDRKSAIKYVKSKGYKRINII